MSQQRTDKLDCAVAARRGVNRETIMMRIIYQPGVALVLGVLVCGCSQQTPQKPSAISKSSPEVHPDVVVSVTPPKAVSTSQPTPPEDTPPDRLTLFLPDGKGKLQTTTMKAPTEFAKQKLWKPESALTMLFRKAPEIIPAGTKLIGSFSKNMNYKDDEGSNDTVFEIRLNKAFLNSNLWRDSRKARLAFDAITQTATAGIEESISPTYPTRILVLVDGKPVRKLGNYKVKNPT